MIYFWVGVGPFARLYVEPPHTTADLVDVPYRVRTTGSLPIGLADDVSYWVIASGGFFRLTWSAKLAAARQGIGITTPGTGRHWLERIGDGSPFTTPGTGRHWLERIGDGSP